MYDELSTGRLGLRIMIVGPPGSGKTTLAKRIGANLNLPVFHIDRLFFGRGWRKTPTEQFIASHEAMIRQPGWVADGNATRHFGPRATHADILIYLRPPRLLCLWRIVMRRLQYHKRERDDRPDHCVERLPWGMVRYTWQYRQRHEDGIRQLARDNPKLRYIEWTQLSPLDLRKIQWTKSF